MGGFEEVPAGEICRVRLVALTDRLRFVALKLGNKRVNLKKKKSTITFVP